MHGPFFDSLERRTLFAGSFGGVVFDDLNGNGVRETNEPGRAGAVLFIDANQNGLADKNEATATTNASGQYVFNNVADGKHELRLRLPAGRRLTAPASIKHEVDVNGRVGDQVRTFGDTTTGVIRGMLFTDINQDTLRQSNEPGLGGWTVFLDKDNDGVIDGNEKVRVTNSRGGYRFAGLTPGTYRVRVVQQSGFARTNPLSGVWVVKNLTFAQSFSNRNFGQRDLEEERP